MITEKQFITMLGLVIVPQVAELFGRYGVFDYIEKYYDVLHTMGTEYIMNDIDEFIAKARSETK